MKSRTVLPGAQALRRSFEKFLDVEAASGVMLLGAAITALLLANSPFAASYHELWRTPLTLGVGTLVVTESLHFWINDGLMTVFFLVVGLEIRRELHEGTLANVRVAVLPAAAAAGGIVAPALIFLALNPEPVLRSGWAIPTATDIAFAVGVLALLGRRVPMSLRILLLAIAIIDDIAAILIIALFYSKGIELLGLVVTGAGIGLVFVFQHIGVRTAWPYVVPGSVIWLGILYTGIHPSIAGVICGLLTPMTTGFGPAHPLASARRALDRFRDSLRTNKDPGSLLRPFRELRDAQLDMLPPALRVQDALHPWVAFGVMPLFALANAGATLGDPAAISESWTLHAGIIGGLLIGKPLGIMLAATLAVRFGWCAYPAGVDWRGMSLIACLAGIGFTMALFIANLAFPPGADLTQATLAVLIGSTAAGIAGLVFGRFALADRGGASAPQVEPAHGDQP